MKLRILLFLLTFALPTHADVFTVTTIADSGDGSLRQAIIDANSNEGKDTIVFNIVTDAGSPVVITIESTLETLFDAVLIDGWSQGGSEYTGPPLVEIDGNLIPGASGLIVQADNCEIRGLAITGFTMAKGGGVGIMINSGNAWIYGNYLGIAPDGETTRGNHVAGIWVGGGVGTVIGTNGDGNNDAAEMNVISGNTDYGLLVDGDSVVVSGNRIGTNAAGTAARSNGTGVYVRGSHVRVGGTANGEGNLISGSSWNGLQVSAFYTTIQGNRIGTNAAGTSSIANGDIAKGAFVAGVYIGEPSTHVLVGGSTAAERNIISGNYGDGVGIWESATSHITVKGNYIGVQVDGTSPLGNTSIIDPFGAGVSVRNFSSNITIGGSAAGEGNIIANSTTNGIVSYSGGPIRIRGNTIYGNGRHGVEINSQVDPVLTGNQITGNTFNGVLLQGVGGATIGGPNAADRNVISGNGFAGINLINTNSSLVQGNYVGVDAAGTVAQGNAVVGITCQFDGSYNNRIYYNVVSANGNGYEGGITVIYGASNHYIRGNIIGLNAAGTAALGNNGAGIFLYDTYDVNVGLPSGEKRSGSVSEGEWSGNTISANSGVGVGIYGEEGYGYGDGSFASVVGNYIGTNPAGVGNFGNTGSGVEIGFVPDLFRAYVRQQYGEPETTRSKERSSGNMIGGLGPGHGNVIANNGGNGITVHEGVENSIIRNSVHSNALLGIDLGGNGVTQNHTGFLSGPNNYQNYPILGFAAYDLQGVSGFMPGLPSQTYTIEVFSSPTADPSGFGEGRTFLGSTTVLTDNDGNATFYIETNGALETGTFVTATATDWNGNTSEFSAAIPVTARVKVFGEGYVVNTTLSGIPLHWPDGNASFHISQNVPSEFETPIVQGYQAWNNLPQLQYTYEGLTPSTVWGGDADGINNNVWVTEGWEELTGLSAAAIAVTRVRYNSLTGQITDADIAYDAEHFSWAVNTRDTTDMDVQNTAAHEAGHFSGVGDIYNPGDPGYVPAMGDDNEDLTMYGLIRFGETLKQTLEPPDSAAIAYIYNTVPASRIDLMLVFDGSPSYTTGVNAFGASVESAVELVDKMRIGDRIGVVKMPSTVVRSLTTIEDSASRAAVKSSIFGLTAGGPSAIGTGLQTAQNQLDNNALPNRTKAMILFSTGEENAPPSALSVLPTLVAAKTQVHTLGFPGSPGQALASTIADSTKGGFHLATNITINQVVGQIWNTLLGQQYIFYTVASSDTFRNVSPPGLQWQGPVDKGTTSIQPGLQWQGGPRGITGPMEGGQQSSFVLSVLPPGGGPLIDSAYVAQNPHLGIRFFSGSNYQYFIINNPTPGVWQLFVYGREFLDEPEPVVLSITAFTDITMGIGFDKAIYDPGEEISMFVTLSAGGQSAGDPHIAGGEPITDAAVVAQVTPPAPAPPASVPLIHAGGGIYTGMFNGTGMPGTYGVTFTATRDTITRQVSQSVYVVDTTTPPPPTNVVVNPGFEEGSGPWMFFTNGSGNYTVVSPGAPGSSRAARVTVTTTGSNVQFYQSGLTLVPNKQYRLKFKAYSSNGRDLAVHVHRHDDPFTNYGLNGVVFDLTTSWQEFTREFTTANFPPPVPSNARLRFRLNGIATNGTIYYIDDVVLEEVNGAPPVATKIRVETAPDGSGVVVPAQTLTTGNSITVYAIARTASDQFVSNISSSWSLTNVTGGVVSGNLVPDVTGRSAVFTAGAAGTARIQATSGGLTPTPSNVITVEVPPPPAANILVNGGFESGPTGWFFNTNGVGSFTTVMPGIVGDRAGQVTITTKNNVIQLYQKDVTLTAGQAYRLSLRALCNTSHNIALSVFKHTSPFTSYGLSGFVCNLSSTWQTFSVDFVASGFPGTVNDARVRIWMVPYGANGDIYRFDEVSLEPIAGVFMAGVPETAAPEATEVPSNFMLMRNYPNPFNPSTRIQYGLPMDARVTLDVYNILGQRVAQLEDGWVQAGYHEAVFDAANLATGLYVYRLTAVADDGTKFSASEKMIFTK